jgi:protein-tyrosine phosphatase
MVDLHCHILPNIDDGARSWEISEQMADLAFEDGITHIVATPHANSQYQYNRERFSGLLNELQKRVGDKLKFSLGCDFNLSFENLEALFHDPKQFLIGNTRYLLIELSDYGIPPDYQPLLFRMRSELGLRPVLTHPERHPILQADPNQVLRWMESGCLIQVTANSLTGHWGPRAKAAAMWLLKKRAIHVLASDAHDTVRRPPILSEARKIAASELGSRAAIEIVEMNPEQIVESGGEVT